jgi:hypothetical protein
MLTPQSPHLPDAFGRGDRNEANIYSTHCPRIRTEVAGRPQILESPKYKADKLLQTLADAGNARIPRQRVWGSSPPVEGDQLTTNKIQDLTDHVTMVDSSRTACQKFVMSISAGRTTIALQRDPCT